MDATEKMRQRVESALGPVRDMPALHLDLGVLGDRLVRLVALSSTLGHAEPASTLGYLGRDGSSEVEFIRDVLTMRTPDIVAKWFSGEGYSGEEGASRMMTFLASTALF